MTATARFLAIPGLFAAALLGLMLVAVRTSPVAHAVSGSSLDVAASVTPGPIRRPAALVSTKGGYNLPTTIDPK